MMKKTLLFVFILLTSISNSFAQISWNHTDAPELQNDWSCIAYGNGTFVTLAKSLGTNRIATSPDGTTWTGRPAPANNSWQGITFGNGKFVAVAGSGSQKVMTSSDGIEWTLQTAPNGNWSSVAYGNNVFVAVAPSVALNQVMTSPDGITWTSQTPAGTGTNLWSDISFGNGMFVALAQAGSTNQLMTSPDGINWSIQTIPNQNFQNWLASAYGNGNFVAISQNYVANVRRSSDGINWVSDSLSPVFGAGVLDIAFGNGYFIAVGNSGTTQGVWVSSDGNNWAFQATPVINGQQPYQFSAIAFGDGYFAGVSINGGGSPDYTKKILVSNKTVGITPLSDNTIAVNVFPNPFTEVLNINSSEKGAFTLNDMNGKLVAHGSIDPGLSAIKVSQMACGVYNLSILVNGGQKTVKVVK